MNVSGIPKHEGTLKKLQDLLESDKCKIHGVFYTNSFFSQRYLSRSHLLVDEMNIEDNAVKLTVSTRLEKVGLMEIESTLAVLEKHTAGDLPGFTPEGLIPNDNRTGRPFVPEPVGVTQQLYSVDLLLILKDPEVTYQEFKIAGEYFTLVNLTHKLEDYYEQTVTLLFGRADKLYLFSHFFDKQLTTEDTRLIMDLIVDTNITGKAIRSVKLETTSGASSSIYPYEELISSYVTTSGDLVFGTGAGYVRIPSGKLKDYKLTCVPTEQSGQYRLDLEGKTETIRLYME